MEGRKKEEWFNQLYSLPPCVFLGGEDKQYDGNRENARSPGRTQSYASLEGLIILRSQFLLVMTGLWDWILYKVLGQFPEFYNGTNVIERKN